MVKPLLALASWVCFLPCAGADVSLEAVEFASRGATLHGTVVLPDGEPRAGVVFIHGSGRQSRDLGLARRFAAQGIAVLVYDKRGAGQSGGQYEEKQSVSEMNLRLLADDASAALQRLSRQPSLAQIPLGFAGISQAGWIAPLAARQNALARFLVLWSGPVCKVSEEDIFSKYTSDAEGGVAPPYSQALRARTSRYVWPDFLGRDTDSREDLAALSIPGFWIFSDNDSSVPVDLSIAGLQELRGRGHRYDYALFSGLGHNNMEHTLTLATAYRDHRIDRLDTCLQGLLHRLPENYPRGFALQRHFV